MVSRRKILSRSQDDLNMDYVPEEEEDVWFNKDKLYKDHVQEVLDKWHQIDDEIWAKVICFERNRRIAKAYARAPVLTINGSDDGFDGYRIGLLGFDNPLRDSKTEEVKKHIGHGVKIKMDDAGNILIKRISKANVFIKETVGVDENNSFSGEALKLVNGSLEPEKPIKLFDMKKFQHNVSKELKRAYPDRRKLEFQCISAIAFVRNDGDLLDSPCWVMIINVVAMDMLKSKLPPVGRRPVSQDGRGRGKLSDEDPYSVPGSGSSGSSKDKRILSNDRPPKLPPRDNTISKYPIPKPDYDVVSDENRFRIPHLNSSRKKASNYLDDPYYCGMKAHTPNFASRGGNKPTSTPPSTNNSSPNSSPPQSIYVKTWMMNHNGAAYPPPSGPPPPPPHHYHHHNNHHHHHQHMATVKGTHRHHHESIYNSNVEDSEWENLWELEAR
ncbi:hypothetical protein CHUAL_006366 [Chamberlinius hualienensis]